ncbi:unnamed protein product [Durusdinium trenchii]|uniref:Secreted protein n=1 Tax=Durusdinium trenchii TaxID=1381693 RepID=A0ABP0H859_9DINO
MLRRVALPWLVVLLGKCSATRVQVSQEEVATRTDNNPLFRPVQRTATQAATEFVAARWAQVEARLPLAARNLFRGRTQGVAPLPVSEELSTMVRPTVRWVPKMPTQQVPLGIGRLGRAPQLPTANAGATVHAALRAPFVRAFRALERALPRGEVSLERTVRPRRSIFPVRARSCSSSDSEPWCCKVRLILYFRYMVEIPCWTSFLSGSFKSKELEEVFLLELI